MNALSYIALGILLALFALFVASFDYAGVRFAIPSETSRLSKIGLSLEFLAMNAAGAGAVCAVINLWFVPITTTWLGRVGAILLLVGAACAVVGGVLMLLDQRRLSNTSSEQ